MDELSRPFLPPFALTRRRSGCKNAAGVKLARGVRTISTIRNTQRAINSRNGFPRISPRTTQPKESTSTPLKRHIGHPAAFGGTPERGQMAEMAGHWEMPARILWLAKCSPPESVRKRRGIFPAGTFWR
jgi:hypothetical protein